MPPIQTFWYSLPFSFGEVPAVMIHNHHSVLSDRAPDPRGSRPFLLHNHSFVEFQYITDGSGVLSTPAGDHELTPGHLLLVPPQLDHRLRLTAPTLSRQTLALLFLSSNTVSPAEFDPFFSACRGSEPLVLDVQAGSPLEHALQALCRLTGTQDPDAHVREIMRAYCILFLTEVSRALPSSDSHRVQSQHPPITWERLVIDNFFSSNYNAKLNAAALADELHISTRQLNRVLQNLYGMGFQEKTNAQRLRIAVDRLTHSDEPIAQIAELLGFGSTTALGVFIRRSTGLTPSQIRRGEPVMIDP